MASPTRKCVNIKMIRKLRFSREKFGLSCDLGIIDLLGFVKFILNCIYSHEWKKKCNLNHKAIVQMMTKASK